MKRVAIYVRVSTEEQRKNGLSVDNQIEALTEFCRDNQFSVVDVYNDAGISARKSYKNRPELLRLINDCQSNRVDLVIFTKLDRFFRSVADYYVCIEQMNNVPWRAIWEDYETETSSGVFKVNIMLSVAQAESDRTSERVKSITDYRRAKGEYIGRPPFGYLVTEDRQLVKDPELEDMVNLIFDTYLSTMSLANCIRTARNAGRYIAKTNLLRMFHNPAYYGVTKQGLKCESYISEDTYRLIQDRMKQNYRSPKDFDRVYLFNRIVSCGDCGFKVRAGAKEGRFYYYRCSGYESRIAMHPGFSWSERKIEKYLLENLDALVSQYNYKVSMIDSSENDAINRKAQLEAKLKRVGIRFEDGDISTEEYREKRDAILMELDSLKYVKVPELVKLPDNWRAVYDELTKENKGKFWHSIIKDIRIYKSRDHEIEVSFL